MFEVSSKTSSESRRQRFRRLAAKRTQEALERLRVLGNCSNRSTYDYSEEDVRRIFAAIDDQVRVVKSKFRVPRRTFKL